VPIKKVDIRPGVSVLAVLRHLNYRPWFALAEFVDNAVGSFVRHKGALEKIDGKGLKLRVDIDIETASPARITIRDNAAGIFESEYSRAFRPAAIPPDRSGLAEFGMGMKSAACWFAPHWTVRTSAIGESVARSVDFDIEDIVNDDIEELTIRETPEKANSHFTAVILKNIFHVPVGRTVTKLKEHLTDIYRGFGGRRLALISEMGFGSTVSRHCAKLRASQRPGFLCSGEDVLFKDRVTRVIARLSSSAAQIAIATSVCLASSI
jgi:hypothetical protein